ncbi:hypothetical protein DL98DRAFT_25094 [Cadophora sp. DSE1049]|nr:hypothetical protein DL98DRAFT_25094 [Cadophora sp. DSE1049]
MDQQYFDPAQQPAAYPSPYTKSCFPSMPESISSSSEAFDVWSQQRNPAPGCETSDTAFSRGSSSHSNQSPYQEEYLPNRRPEDSIGGEYYNYTERTQTYRQNINDVAVHNGPMKQYSYTGRNLHQNGNGFWTAGDGVVDEIPGFTTSFDESNATATPDYLNMDDTSDAMDYDDNETVIGTEQQLPLRAIADFEAMYQPAQCYLVGCRKGYVFETFQSFRAHLKNVHSKTIFCNFPSCPHLRPFGNKTDLSRHTMTRHGDKSDKPYKCLREDCPARVTAFKRKDKLKEHDGKYHASYKCFYCPRLFESFEGVAQHTNTKHVDADS